MSNRLNELFMMFQTKGFMPIELPELFKDIFEIMDNATYELISSLVEGNVS